jgi:beta-carotene 3-hydroxylase
MIFETPLMIFMIPFLVVGFTFLAMEGLSYVLHRYLFHGVLWRIHQSHHIAKVGRWGRAPWHLETNDLFSFLFAAFAVAAFAWPPTWWIGFGITLYGTIYFVVHDAVTHRRFFPLDLNWAWVVRIRDAHRAHHNDVSKVGVGPYGLFFP